MAANPVLIARIRTTVCHETPRTPENTGVHQREGRAVDMDQDCTAGILTDAAKRRDAPNRDEAPAGIVKRAGQPRPAKRTNRSTASAHSAASATSAIRI